MTIDTTEFYDQLAPHYHEIFGDWSASVARQAGQLDGIIRKYAGQPHRTVLDASCGIGTQALGLAGLGYEVTGSDISFASIMRARREARKRRLKVEFKVADMRKLRAAHKGEFDSVISCDNAIPHLLSDKQILTALRQMRLCTRVGGLCLLTVRDYDAVDRNSMQIKPYGIFTQGKKRVMLFQTWQFRGDKYTLSIYRVEEQPGRKLRTAVFKSKYYAVSTQVLIRLLQEAGFSGVRRLDDVFYQPVIIGTRRK